MQTQSEAGSQESGTNSVEWLAGAWQGALRRVLEARAEPDGQPVIRVDATLLNQAAWQQWAASNWCRLDLDGVPGAAISAGCPQPTMEIMRRLVSGDAAPPEADCRQAFLEVLDQNALLVADAISTRLRRRVSFSPAQFSDSPSEPQRAIRIDFSASGSEHTLILAPTGKLIETLAGPSEMTPAPARPALVNANLDLLMEVELPLCVTFGRRQLPLKDVLKLSSGSIVELNRLVNEPVEVRINNVLIARGEVVVVDGNYGIRVTEIVNRQERMRSIS